jgi:lysine decarboxylase
MPTTITALADPPFPTTAAAAAPYLEAVRGYAGRRPGRFHVPAHKGGAGAPAQLTAALGDALTLDVPSCIEGVDIGGELPPLAHAERLAAATWGARRTWFLVNGASEASHALCLALAQSAGDVVVQRNVHQSTIHGLVLGGVRPHFVMPALDEELGIAHCVTPGEIADALDRAPDAGAVFIVSPTYFGAAADVRGIAAVCRRRGVALVVDEAWGAHFRFHDGLPQDALAAGADVVISGTHKLIGSLTQSAMLHVGSAAGGPLDDAAIARALRLVRTTSPSSLLLASLDAARAQVDANGRELVERALREMAIVKQLVGEVPGLRVLGDELAGGHGVVAFDALRLAIDVRATGLDGHLVADDLLRTRDINLELVTERVLIAHVGIGEPVLPEGRRLVDALRAVLTGARPAAGLVPQPLPAARFGEPVLPPRDAFFAAHELVDLRDAAGRISADSIAAYPPGIANVLPGERFTAPLVEYLLAMTLRGCPVRGTWDEETATVRVLRNAR